MTSNFESRSLYRKICHGFQMGKASNFIQHSVKIAVVTSVLLLLLPEPVREMEA